MSISQSSVNDRFSPGSAWIDESIITVPLSISNRSGKTISGFMDHLSEPRAGGGVVVIVPGYGKTKTSHLRIAYYLAINGLRVIRYDHSNHVGDSEGSMLFTTLGQMEEDLASVVDFAQAEASATPIGVMAESLGARIALKLASKDERIRFFISLIGVFDVQETLRRIYNEDGFIEKANGNVLGIRDIMGFQVDADRFIEDAERRGFHSLESAVEDARKLLIPTFFFVAQNDPWVSQEAVQSVFRMCPSNTSNLKLLPGIMHELYENPVVAADTCGEIVRAAIQSVRENIGESVLIRVPSEKNVISRSRLEKRRTSKDLKSAEEKVFWTEYLEKYAYIVKLQDYWNLLDSIAVNLGGWKKGDKILDAGCGIGNFGTFLLVRNLYQSMQLRTASLRRKPWAQYVGVDFIEAALRQAGAVHREIYQEFAPKVDWVTDGIPLIDFSYSICDLDACLPFKSQYFDKIISNLVLSYVKDPLFTLGEMCRTLKDGGRIIVSSLKPHADLSQIYRNYISVSRTQEEMEQARKVLSNAGLIKYKEAEGFYQFFSESQIENLLREVGCDVINVYRAFGGQANVAVGQKLSP